MEYIKSNGKMFTYAHSISNNTLNKIPKLLMIGIIWPMFCIYLDLPVTKKKEEKREREWMSGNVICMWLKINDLFSVYFFFFFLFFLCWLADCSWNVRRSNFQYGLMLSVVWSARILFICTMVTFVWFSTQIKSWDFSNFESFLLKNF